VNQVIISVRASGDTCCGESSARSEPLAVNYGLKEPGAIALDEFRRNARSIPTSRSKSAPPSGPVLKRHTTV